MEYNTWIETATEGIGKIIIRILTPPKPLVYHSG
jgi:hypothetical protein